MTKLRFWMDLARWRFWRIVYRISKAALNRSRRELGIEDQDVIRSRYRWRKR